MQSCVKKGLPRLKGESNRFERERFLFYSLTKADNQESKTFLRDYRYIGTYVVAKVLPKEIILFVIVIRTRIKL